MSNNYKRNWPVHNIWALAPAGNFFGGGGSEVHQGRACKGVTAWGVPGAEPPGRRRSFQKFCKKSNEKFTIF